MRRTKWGEEKTKSQPDPSETESGLAFDFLFFSGVSRMPYGVEGALPILFTFPTESVSQSIMMLKKIIDQIKKVGDS